MLILSCFGVFDKAIVRVRRVFWRRSSQPIDQMISRVTASLSLFFKFSEVTTRRQNHYHLLLLTHSVFRDIYMVNWAQDEEKYSRMSSLSTGCNHMLEDVP